MRPLEGPASEGEEDQGTGKCTSRLRWAGVAGGLALAVAVYLAMPASVGHSARITAATALLMGVWWMTEAIPIPATALLPVLVFPVARMVDEDGDPVGFNDVGASYGNNIIFLFMGGFLLALAMQRWNLHRRIAMHIVRVMGSKSHRMIGGFMIATGFLSMWVSNTATAVMMLPLGISVLGLVSRQMHDEAAGEGGAGGVAGGGAAEDRVADDRAAGHGAAEGCAADDGAAEDRAADGGAAGHGAAESGAGGAGGTEGAARAGDVATADAPQPVADTVVRSKFGTALMLGIAYSASLGSLATIIGTPPNTLLAGYMEDTYGIHIGFGQWMLVGVPLAVVFLFLCWLLLTRVLFRPEMDEIPGGRELVTDELRKLGPMSSGEQRVLVIFVFAAAGWVFIPVAFDDPPIGDAGIAMAAGIALFLLPAGTRPGVKLLDWDTALRLPWGVLLLFGGGLALSAQFNESGLSEWIGQEVSGIGALPVVVIVLIIAAMILGLTELTSNTATAATFLPVVSGVALGIGLDPMLLAIPTALAATCAFMLPVATPPNAVAYGSGYVTIGSMIRGGFWLNIISVALVTLTTMTLAVRVFGLGG